MTRKHHTEDRRSPGTMGIQRRIVSAKLQGPWVQGANTTAAWKAYKAARRRQDKQCACSFPHPAHDWCVGVPFRQEPTPTPT